jgi:hypothetical protein
MSRWRSVMMVGVALILVVALFPVTAGAAPAAQEGTARVRFVHASFDAPDLDAYVDGTRMAGGLSGDTGYMDVPAGQHTFSFRAAGGAADAASVDANVTSGERVTIAAMNVFAALEARAYVDDVTAPARYRAKIKVINAIPDGGPIGATIADLSLANGLAYGEVSAVGQMVAGYFDVTVTGADGTPLVSESGKAINADRAYTIFVVGTMSSGTYRLATYESTVLQPEPTSNFMFANFAQGLQAVDAYINKGPEPLYSGVPFSSVQQSFTAGLGPYLIELYQPGTGPANGGVPLASGTFEIGANQSVMFAAQGTKDALQVGAYVADLSPIPPQSSRLTIINLAAGNPPFRVEQIEGGTLIESLDVFEESSAVVPAGSYNIRFADASTGAKMMEQGGIQLPEGTVTLLIAYDDDPSDPLINALVVSSNQVEEYAAIRWAHLNVDGPTVDIYMDDQPTVTGLGYKMTTDYKLYPPKVYDIKVYPAGADPATAQLLYQESMDLTGTSFPRTVFVYGQPDQAQLGVVPDSLEVLPAGTGRIRFVNAAIDVPGVAVYLAADGSRIVDNIVFGDGSSNFNVPAGTYVYNFVASSGEIGRAEVTVEEGQIYTVVLGGSATDPTGVETFELVEAP